MMVNNTSLLTRNEFSYDKNSFGRNSRLVVKTKDSPSATDLIPTLFEMAKSVMKIRCNLDKTNVDSKVLEEFSNLESDIMKIAVDIEYLNRKGL